eukprot:10825425-Alexandrium_andersonii.AAC.1
MPGGAAVPPAPGLMVNLKSSTRHRSPAQSKSSTSPSPRSCRRLYLHPPRAHLRALVPAVQNFMPLALPAARRPPSLLPPPAPGLLLVPPAPSG